ncbi:MAG TPA: hypothetical protein PKV86_11620, partial [Syntrophobacteraceae bacterium]|nr:hypothetical protein [Syntrophobacteraceae bacterium]
MAASVLFVLTSNSQLFTPYRFTLNLEPGTFSGLAPRCSFRYNHMYCKSGFSSLHFSVQEERIMPIYEFFCDECMTVFTFYSRAVNTTTIPGCPKCTNRKLSRMMSAFAAISGSRKDTDDADLPIDESKMEGALRFLESNMSSMSEDDPRQATALIRQMTEAMGGNLDEGVEEALRRVEAGEDPEKVEAEMGDQLDP